MATEISTADNFVRYTTKPCRHCPDKHVTSVLVTDARRTVERKNYRGEGTRCFDSVYVDAAGREYLHDSMALIIPCAGTCGGNRHAYRVFGKIKLSVKCDARCTGATGHHCECSCGGKNHGADHSVGV